MDGSERRHRRERTGTVSTSPLPPLTKQYYERIADLRRTLREFARNTELEAERIGLTPQQYQLLLAIKGFPLRDWASVGELAERLQIRHNAIVGLVRRAEQRGLVERMPYRSGDRRKAYIRLTSDGDVALAQLAGALRAEREKVLLAVDLLSDAPAREAV